MREEAHNQPAWRQEMAQKLGNLKPLLSTGGDDVNQFFDDFVREQEWGLALHVVCDYLLERKTQTAPTAVIQQIEALHEAMGIVDTCAADLRRKAGRGGTPLRR
jgi:hypothetical protein